MGTFGFVVVDPGGDDLAGGGLAGGGISGQDLIAEADVFDGFAGAVSEQDAGAGNEAVGRLPSQKYPGTPGSGATVRSAGTTPPRRARPPVGSAVRRSDPTGG
ncbi:hypothetical protein Aglo03_35230 [Actinokineospora globicatena]|uniref:Uncharacterized protein n=1 Tax=Actinokineospora globicatena TaxID=103729 RepID=A0A9W6QQC0_9PSEU|nr:hypothetical protein Aglo03_35230 [Actinokineospora globicatena]